MENYDLGNVKRTWGLCREALGLSEAQCLEFARLPRKASFVDLKYADFFKFLRTFNVSLELLDNGQVCFKTLVEQFQGRTVFSHKALGNQGSRSQIILKMGSCLKDDEFGDILASFQLSKELLSQEKNFFSAEIVDVLSKSICDKAGGMFWIKKLAKENCHESLGNGGHRNRQAFINFLDNTMNRVEKNFNYQIEKIEPKSIKFSCAENERTRQYFRGYSWDYAWLFNIKFFTEAYFNNSVEVRILQNMWGGASRNHFEICFH